MQCGTSWDPCPAGYSTTAPLPVLLRLLLHRRSGYSRAEHESVVAGMTLLHR